MRNTDSITVISKSVGDNYKPIGIRSLPFPGASALPVRRASMSSAPFVHKIEVMRRNISILTRGSPMTPSHLQASPPPPFFYTVCCKSCSLSGRPATDHLAGEKNFQRISARAIICDDRLAPAGQTSVVAIETKQNKTKDCA